jgi:hypothetical protein
MVKDSCTEMFITTNTEVYWKYILQPPQTGKYNINSSTRYTVTTSKEGNTVTVTGLFYICGIYYFYISITKILDPVYGHASTTADWLLSCVCLANVSVLWPLASLASSSAGISWHDFPANLAKKSRPLEKHFRSQV